MGRRPTKNTGLPPRMRVKTGKKGQQWFYYDTGEKPRREIPLGSDYSLAVRKWGELEGDRSKVVSDVVTFRVVAERYEREVVPTKAPRTQKDNAVEIKKLLEFFDNPPAPLEHIRPIHVREYLDWRSSAKVRANRERALLSAIWNFARSKGYTDKENPCRGIEGHAEKGRKHVYVEDDAYRAVWDAADAPTRDAMDLAYLTGQRPQDVIAFDEMRVQDGRLMVRQRKTGTPLRIQVEGELKAVLARIAERKRSLPAYPTALVVDERGKPLTAMALWKRFDKARTKAGIAKGAFQMRDLRAKAGTDKADSAGDIREAQAQLGHASIVMTEHYLRERRGKIVKPTR